MEPTGMLSAAASALAGAARMSRTSRLGSALDANLRRHREMVDNGQLDEAARQLAGLVEEQVGELRRRQGAAMAREYGWAEFAGALALVAVFGVPACLAVAAGGLWMVPGGALALLSLLFLLVGVVGLLRPSGGGSAPALPAARSVAAESTPALPVAAPDELSSRRAS